MVVRWYVLLFYSLVSLLKHNALRFLVIIQMNFIVWILLNIALKFVRKCRRQATIWTNYGKFNEACMRHPASIS